MASGYDKYIKGQVLGKGSFGQAVLVTHKATGHKYVIKEIDVSRMGRQERVASEQEAKLLMALNHPNIVRCIECFTHMNKLCIVMDWCSEGDLYTICQKRRGASLTEDTILDWFVQMCLALKHVHDRKILHRDIKTQNIFVSAGGLLKLGDFGVSKILASTWQLAATAVGTPYYLSPEICQNKSYNQKSDIWSLGCVLYELTVGRHAFEAPSMRALIQKIIKGQYPPVPAMRSKELRELVDRMLTINWDKRPSINDILATPIIKARITKFLSATLQAHEFSHTIIHGRPRQGQLVVQHVSPAGAPPAVQKEQAAGVQPRLPAPAGIAAAKPGLPDANRLGSAAAARARAQDAAAAAKARAVQAAKEREDAAAAAAVAAAARRDDEVKRQREQAAMAARREVERMKLEEQRKKVEAERVRLEGERRKAELARQEAERKAQISEEAARRAAADEARRRAEAEARRAKAEEEARAKAAERAARERKREEERAKMAQQRREYYAQQQQQAARNRAAVEQQLQHGAVEPPAAKPRKQWVIPEPELAGGAGAAQDAAPRGDPGPLTPEQRRAIWEEQKAAAQRNRRAAAESEQQVGLANFLQVPSDDPPVGQPRQPSPQTRQATPSEARPSPEALQQAYERRRKKLEDEAAARQAEIVAYQQAHHREMREAAARNRAAIMAEVEPPAATEVAGEGSDEGAVAASEMEFAAMIKDMQDILGNDLEAKPEDASAQDESEDELLADEAQAAALAGRFFLNGEEVPLPVRQDDSLALKAEALRCYLETQLGTQAFVRVYKRLESLSLTDDESEVSKEFLAVLGADRLPYLQLIHQLIVLEENLNSAA